MSYVSCYRSERPNVSNLSTKIISRHARFNYQHREVITGKSNARIQIRLISIVALHSGGVAVFQVAALRDYNAILLCIRHTRSANSYSMISKSCGNQNKALRRTPVVNQSERQRRRLDRKVCSPRAGPLHDPLTARSRQQFPFEAARRFAS